MKNYEVQYSTGEGWETLAMYTSREAAQKAADKINKEWDGNTDEPHDAVVLEVNDEKFYIAILGNYYLPDIQGERSVRWASHEQGEAMPFDSIEEAKAWIEEAESDVYVTSHNEAGRPEYMVVDERVYDYISGGRNQDMSNYDWDGAECDCGECETCIDMMIDQDRDYVRGEAQK